MPANRQVHLAARPSGLPSTRTGNSRPEPVTTPGPGQFVVAISHKSIDPATRGWMNASASYIPPVELGTLMLSMPGWSNVDGIGRDRQGFGN